MIDFFNPNCEHDALEAAADSDVLKYVGFHKLAESIARGSDVQRFTFGGFNLHIGFDSDNRRCFWVENLASYQGNYHAQITIPHPHEFD